MMGKTAFALAAFATSLVLGAPASSPTTTTLTTSAAPTATPSSLKPWQLNQLYALQPQGQPYQSNYSGLSVVISDPNYVEAGPAPRGSAYFYPSNATCSVQWPENVSPPWGEEVTCSSDLHDQSTWTFSLGKGASGTLEDFTLNFNLVDVLVDAQGRTDKKSFNGQGYFKAGDNLIEQCSLPGCLYFLKIPYTQTFPIYQSQY